MVNLDELAWRLKRLNCPKDSLGWRIGLLSRLESKHHSGSTNQGITCHETMDIVTNNKSTYLMNLTFVVFVIPCPRCSLFYPVQRGYSFRNPWSPKFPRPGLCRQLHRSWSFASSCCAGATQLQRSLPWC